MTIWPQLLPVLLLGSFCRVTPGNWNAVAQESQSNIFWVFWLRLHVRIPFSFCPFSALGLLCVPAVVSPVARRSLFPYICLSAIPLFFSSELLFQFLKIQPLYKVPQFPVLSSVYSTEWWDCLKIIYALLPFSAFHVPFTDYWKIQILVMSKSENLQCFLIGGEK